MKLSSKLVYAFFTVTLLASLIFVSKSFAIPPTPFKTICHHTPANQVTLDFQNEQSYNGHLGTPHSTETFDTDGACTEVTSTPTPTPCEEDCVTPTVTPTPTETLTPTPTPSGGDGSACQSNCAGSGGGDGSSNTPPSNSGPTQAVLGASTMAGTGTFETSVMNFMLLAGMMVSGTGFLSYAKEKKA